MNERTSSSISVIVACICIAAYALALLVGGIQIGRNIKDRRIAAEQEFFNLVSRSSRVGAQAFMDEAFQGTMQDALGNSGNLQGIILTGPDAEYAFERGLSGTINWVGDSPRFARQFGTSSKAFFSPLQVEGLRNVTISAVYGYLDFDFFLYVLKRTLIIVLVALTVAFFCLILESVTDKKQAEEESESIPSDVPSSYQAPGGSRRGTAAGKPAEQAKGTVFHEKTPESPPLPDSDSGTSDDDLFDDLFEEAENEIKADSSIPDDFPDIAPDADIAADTDADITSAADTDTDAEEPVSPAPPEKLESRGLYAPSGISWEDHTLDRLEAELRRCDSSGQDLTVMVLEYGNADDPEGIWFSDFVRMTSDYFKFKDMIFEKGKTGITVILPGMDLDSGMEKANEFRARIPTTFTQGLAVGLSSRLGRLVKADRIMLEAVRASVKSKEDPEAPIIAFKSDLDKFRAFIEKKSVE
jgi:hypothetical protein